jgi:hypothetical protein
VHVADEAERRAPVCEVHVLARLALHLLQLREDLLETIVEKRGVSIVG